MVCLGLRVVCVCVRAYVCARVRAWVRARVRSGWCVWEGTEGDRETGIRRERKGERGEERAGITACVGGR